MSLPAQNIKIINNTFLKFQTQRQRLAHLHLSKSKFTYQIQSMESQYAFPMSATTAESSPKLPQLLGNHSAIKLHLHHSQNMLLLTIDKLPLNIRSISVPLHNISPYFKSSDSHVTETVSLPNKSKKTLIGQSSKHPLRMYFS